MSGREYGAWGTVLRRGAPGRENGKTLLPPRRESAKRTMEYGRRPSFPILPSSNLVASSLLWPHRQIPVFQADSPSIDQRRDVPSTRFGSTKRERLQVFGENAIEVPFLAFIRCSLAEMPPVAARRTPVLIPESLDVSILSIRRLRRPLLRSASQYRS